MIRGVVAKLVRCLLWTAIAWGGIAPGAMAAESSQPRLRIGVDGDRRGTMSFVDAQGQPAGFSRDLFDEMARMTGKQFELIPGSWKDLTANFAAGKIDVLANVLMTEERRATMDFSIPHATCTGSPTIWPGDPGYGGPQTLPANGSECFPAPWRQAMQTGIEAGVARW